MSKYEIMYIIRANLDQDQTKGIIAEINGLFTGQSKVLECKEIGLRDLAYEIEHSRKGYYVWTHVEAEDTAIREFTRRANINENIIRHITVKEEV